MGIRVLIADDHAVLRAGLRLLINAQPDMEVVGEAADGIQTVQVASELHPDVIILDLCMRGQDGVQAIGRLREVDPKARVLVLTMYDDPAYLRSALAAGCAGYVIKRAADVELIGAIRAIVEGRTIVNASLGTEAGGELQKQQAWTSAAGLKSLTPRELEVLRLVAQGYTNHEVADRLSLSVKTVETHRARVMEKLHLETRAELVRYAIDHALLSTPHFTD